MQPKHNEQLVPLAKQLRKGMTKEERHLWYDFLRDHPYRFVRQKVLGRYIADFYCAKAKLVIELDGSQHYKDTSQDKDAVRTAFLEQYGLRVLRILNNEIHRNFRGVCEYINAAIEKPPLGDQGARKGALPVAEQATAAVGQPLALADRNAGREGLAATRRWREAPEGIRTGNDRPFPAIRQRSVAGGLQLLSLASRASSPYTGEPFLRAAFIKHHPLEVLPCEMSQSQPSKCNARRRWRKTSPRRSA